MKKARPRPVQLIEMEIRDLEAQIRKLKGEKTEALRAQRRSIIDADMMNLLMIIVSNHGISAAEIHKEMTVTEWDYPNKMTALVRRGLIINHGTRRNPAWYPTFGPTK